jgi:hypothetical protein
MGGYLSTYLPRQSPRIDYVAFPVGLALDPRDPRSVLLSLGHQDEDGFVLRLEVDGLARSLQLVHACSG